MRRGLTAHQQHVLDYMRIFHSMNDALPSARTIARAFGHASPNAASDTMLALQAKGVLEHNEVGGYRFVRGAATTPLRAALMRAAAYLAPKCDADASIDESDADNIAAALTLAAQGLPA